MIYKNPILLYILLLKNIYFYSNNIKIYEDILSTIFYFTNLNNFNLFIYGEKYVD
jgi:hypothetical protein